MPDKQINEISFFIAAHADDWQLFMFPNVYNDIIAQNSKVIFIITTAGDAGLNKAYWLSREEGAKSSLRFCLAFNTNIVQSEGVKEFNEHPVYYWSANNVTFYFLRLPDGNIDGSGFAATKFESLSKLKCGELSTITCVDNSTTYNGWKDFYTTLQCIISEESNYIKKVWVNYLNPDVTINPNDHADHTATGKAIQAIPFISNLSQILFKGYCTSHSTNKLQPSEFFLKTGMLVTYDKAVFDNSGYSTLKEGTDIYLQWCLCCAEYVVVSSDANVDGSNTNDISISNLNAV